MPTGPLPPDLEAFVAAPHPAVVATTRANGSPLTAATWYAVEEGRIVLSMGPNGARARNLRRDGRFSLTVLDEDWYNQVTVECRVLEIRDDPDFVDIDRIAARYAETYERDEGDVITVLGAIDRWHAYGSPGGA